MKMAAKAAKTLKMLPDDDDFLPTVGGKAGARKAEISKAAYDQAIAPFTKSAESFIAEIAHELPIWADRGKLHSAAKRAGVLVRAMRNYAGLTQQVLGQDAKIKQSDVSAIESGSGENGPTFELLSRVAEACDCYVTFVPRTVSKKPVALNFAELEAAIHEGVRVFLSGNVPVKAIKAAAAEKKVEDKKSPRRVVLNPVTREITVRGAETKRRKGRGLLTPTLSPAKR